jgi:hypothetical protein
MFVLSSSRVSASAFDVGAVVWVQLLNGIENRHTTGKPRPAVLISEHVGHWLAMGLTTLPTYRDGRPRVAIPNPLAVGLLGPGYLWGSRLARISRIDVLDRLGSVDLPLADTIIQLANLSGPMAHSLRLAAHARPAQ